MRWMLLTGIALAAGLAAPFASAQNVDMAACETKFEELLDRLAAEIMPPYQKSEYMGFILGGYQRCIANQPDAWGQVNAYFDKKDG